MIVSLPAPPSTVSLTTPAARPAALIVSLPPTRVDDELIVGALGAGDGDRRRQAGDRDRAVPLPLTLIVSLPLVPLTMTVSACAVAGAAAGRAGEVDRRPA